MSEVLKGIKDKKTGTLYGFDYKTLANVPGTAVREGYDVFATPQEVLFFTEEFPVSDLPVKGDIYIVTVNDIEYPMRAMDFLNRDGDFTYAPAYGLVGLTANEFGLYGCPFNIGFYVDIYNRREDGSSSVFAYFSNVSLRLDVSDPYIIKIEHVKYDQIENKALPNELKYGEYLKIPLCENVEVTAEFDPGPEMFSARIGFSDAAETIYAFFMNSNDSWLNGYSEIIINGVSAFYYCGALNGNTSFCLGDTPLSVYDALKRDMIGFDNSFFNLSSEEYYATLQFSGPGQYTVSINFYSNNQAEVNNHNPIYMWKVDSETGIQTVNKVSITDALNELVDRCNISDLRFGTQLTDLYPV